MKDQKSHKALMAKVNMYLDNELTKTEERALLQELKQNPVYFDLLNKEKSFREFLKVGFNAVKFLLPLFNPLKIKLRPIRCKSIDY